MWVRRKIPANKARKPHSTDMHALKTLHFNIFWGRLEICMYMKVISSDIRKIIIVVVGAIKNLNQNQSHEVRIKVHVTFNLCDDPNAERE